MGDAKMEHGGIVLTLVNVFPNGKDIFVMNQFAILLVLKMENVWKKVVYISADAIWDGNMMPVNPVYHIGHAHTRMPEMELAKNPMNVSVQLEQKMLKVFAQVSSKFQPLYYLLCFSTLHALSSIGRTCKRAKDL